MDDARNYEDKCFESSDEGDEVLEQQKRTIIIYAPIHRRVTHIVTTVV